MKINQGIKETSCIVTINVQRRGIADKIESIFKKTVELSENNMSISEENFFDCLALVNIGNALDLITDNERIAATDKISDFFSGKPVSKIEFPDIKQHYMSNYTVLDFILIEKINIQERINDNIKGYMNFNVADKAEGYEKDDYIFASKRMLNFAKGFSIINDKEYSKALSIIEKIGKNNFENKKIVFVPENFYTKVPASPNN